MTGGRQHKVIPILESTSERTAGLQGYCLYVSRLLLMFFVRLRPPVYYFTCCILGEESKNLSLRALLTHGEIIACSSRLDDLDLNFKLPVDRFACRGYARLSG